MTASENQREFRPTGLVRLISQTFSVYAKNFPVLIAFALVPELLFFQAERSLPMTNYALFGAAGFLWVIAFGGTICIVSRPYLDPPVGILGCYAQGLLKIPNVLVSAILFVLLLIFSALLSVVIIGIPLFLSMLIAWFLIAPAVLIDNENPVAALKTGRSLVKGNWWSTLGFIAFSIFVTLLLIAIPVATILWVTDSTVGGVIGIVFSALAFPVIPISAALKYIDLRTLQISSASVADETTDELEAARTADAKVIENTVDMVPEVAAVESGPAHEIAEVELDLVPEVIEIAPEPVPETVEIEAEPVLQSEEAEVETHADTEEANDRPKTDLWQCLVCEAVYDSQVGDEANGYAPGTPFENLPEEWECSSCGTSKDWFENVELKSQGLESAYGEVHSGS